DTAAGELLKEQDLIGIAARESIGVEHVDAIDGTGGGLVPESFETRADQDIASVAVVHEAQFGLAVQAVAGDALRERLELAGNRVVLDLLFPGDAGIDRHAESVIEHGGSSSPGLGSETPDHCGGRLVDTGARSRPSQGPAHDRDQGMIRTFDQLFMESCELET